MILLGLNNVYCVAYTPRFLASYATRPGKLVDSRLGWKSYHCVFASMRHYAKDTDNTVLLALPGYQVAFPHDLPCRVHYATAKNTTHF